MTKQFELPDPNVDHATLCKAYDFFNRGLWGGALPKVVITVRASGNTYGYFSAQRFKQRRSNRVAAEIALNPNKFDESDISVLQTLVHEMCHVWRFQQPDPHTPGYHDKLFAAEMRRVGLRASDDGTPAGNETGWRMFDYVLPGGKFEALAKKFLAKGKIHWHARDTVDKILSTADPGVAFNYDVAGSEVQEGWGRIRFSCPKCFQLAWAKPTACLVCGHCYILMQADPAVRIRRPRSGSGAGNR